MKITVAIPTIAGRQQYLKSALKTCTTQDYGAMEILVSDNSENCSARDLVEGLGDPRIRYISPNRYLPMSKHWDYLVSQIDGDMFTIIGDDDGLMPNSLVRVAQLSQEHGMGVIHHSLCNYKWPDFPDENLRNVLEIFHDSGTAASRKLSKETLLGLCRAELRYVDGPMVYHNFIPTRLVKNAYRDGVFFRRSSPDVYSSIALCCMTESYLSIGEFLTISGQGSLANGAAVARSGSTGDKFMFEANKYFSPRFKSRSIQFALLDCIYEASATFSKPELLEDIDFKNHLVKALLEMKSIRGWDRKKIEISQIASLAKEHGVRKSLIFHLVKGLSVAAFSSNQEVSSDAYSGLNKPLSLKRGSTIRCDGAVSNIYEATRYLSSLLPY